MDANLGLVRIHLDLEDWALLRTLLLRVLQCDAVVKFCASFATLPWEYDQVLNSSQAPLHKPVFPASTDNEMGRRQSCHLHIEPTVPGAKTQNILHGYDDIVPTEVHERQSAVELRAVSDSEQALAEIRARLDAAASEFPRKFAPSQSTSRLTLMETCSCVFDDETNDAIAALITLSEKEAILRPVDASHYRNILSAVRQIPKAASRHLGSLELIYKIYQRFPAKPIFGSAQATAIPSTSTNSKRAQPQLWDDSDEHSSDDSTNDLQVNGQDGSSEFDWDW